MLIERGTCVVLGLAFEAHQVRSEACHDVRVTRARAGLDSPAYMRSIDHLGCCDYGFWVTLPRIAQSDAYALPPCALTTPEPAIYLEQMIYRQYHALPSES